MKAVQSVQIDDDNSSTCAISLLSALDSFGDVSIESATSTVRVVLKKQTTGAAKNASGTRSSGFKHQDVNKKGRATCDTSSENDPKGMKV